MLTVACARCSESLTSQESYPSYADAVAALTELAADDESGVVRIGDHWYHPQCAPAPMASAQQPAERS